MKINRALQTALSSALLIAASSVSLLASQDCEDVATRVKAATKEDPATVLVVVEDAIAKNEDCACEIVTAAITASKADKSEELLKQIVITALNAAQSQAATIAECAVTAAPDSASAIKEALHVALGGNGNGNGYGKGPVGKQPMPSKETVEIDDDPYAGRPIAISGIYLIPPVAPAASLVQEIPVEKEKEPSDPDEKERRTTTPPPVSPPNFNPNNP